MTISLRPEQPGDAEAIDALTREAFASAPHADGNEADIVDRLRRADALRLSLVAEDRGAIVGHIAFSPVTIDGAEVGWFGLGPVSVLPECQGDGIGSRLIREGLDRLRASGAGGSVLVGEPAFYSRFGFHADPKLILPDIPPEYFQVLCWRPPMPPGTVAYHPAFGMG